MMKKTLALGVIAVAMLSASSAVAQTTETFTATATVTSALQITEDQALTFGNLVAVLDNTNAPSGTLSPTGTWTTTTQVGSENLVQIGTPTAGQYTVDVGVPAFINVQVTFPGTTVVANGAAPPGNNSFEVEDFTVGSTLGAGSFAGATNTATLCNTAIVAAAGGDCQFTTSAAGLLTFSVGAVITAASASAAFTDGTYTGSFDLVASYY